ncbi:MAG: hypothetical protein ABSB50_03410 [Terracidiphilus sp.]|jgi:hypothetical protein
MNSNPHNPKTPDSGLSPAEETLRLVASVPAPEGLEDRVHAALRIAPRTARVFAWPKVFRPENNWIRATAAAAIVFVIAGGGWGVYTRVERNQPAKVIVMPPRAPEAGGFSGAGAIRVPQTLPGPTAPQPAKANPARPKAVTKAAGRAKTKTSSVIGRPSALGEGSSQPDASK